MRTARLAILMYTRSESKVHLLASSRLLASKAWLGPAGRVPPPTPAALLSTPRTGAVRLRGPDGWPVEVSVTMVCWAVSNAGGPRPQRSQVECSGDLSPRRVGPCSTSALLVVIRRSQISAACGYPRGVQNSQSGDRQRLASVQGCGDGKGSGYRFRSQ